uniref:Uncharacterized protein n=1 Tax=Quercus lobata TaxID=97700 RepID=A0A7N2MNF2_QUELO
MAMGMASKTAGDWAFRAFTTGLACGTLYFAYGFSVNVYRGISWHKAHVSKMSNFKPQVGNFNFSQTPENREGSSHKASPVTQNCVAILNPTYYFSCQMLNMNIRICSSMVT